MALVVAAAVAAVGVVTGEDIGLAVFAFAIVLALAWVWKNAPLP